MRSATVAQLIETSTTKNVFLWYRFQMDAHFFFEAKNDGHSNRMLVERERISFLKFRLTFTLTKYVKKSSSMLISFFEV